MIYKEKRIILKNGKDSIIRNTESSDAKAIIAHMKQTSGETLFMARYAEEVTKSVEAEKKMLEEIKEDLRNLMICAVINDKIVANAGFSCVKNNIKYLHRAEFGISIQKEYWNLGLGSIIISELIKKSKEAEYEQIELEVVCDNERAIALYQKHGFEIYGTREKSFKYKDGTYGAEHLMLRRL